MNFTTLIDSGSLRELLSRAGDASSDPRIVVLDCRFDLSAPEAGREAYLAAHIPGARYIDLNRDLSSPICARSGRHPLPSPEVLAERLAALGLGGLRSGGTANGETRDELQVVAYDEASGAFAARAWWLLRRLGHRQVAVLEGGFKAWVAEGGAVERGEPRADHTATRRAASAPAAPPAEREEVQGGVPLDHDDVVTAAAVLQAVRDPERLVVDARSAERFTGAVEPVDPVAGHIPGAVNYPFGNNLGADGHFLPAAELRRRWQERLAGTAPENVILMCGSGVTACHNLLAMELAGLHGAKLYAGSWSEWIRDPERPVARGGERPSSKRAP